MLLINKFLATTPKDRWRRVSRFLRDRTMHRVLLFVKKYYYGDFYLQWRPADELRTDRLAEARKVLRDWSAADIGLSQDPARVYLLIMNIKALDARSVGGAFAEVGVYRGDTARILARLAGSREIYLFDTFDGFDAKDLRAEGAINSGYIPPENFSDNSLDTVRRALCPMGNIKFCVGRFPDTVENVNAEVQFALAHFDADLYHPALEFCAYFYPRMSPGGVMIFHNYSDPDYPGTKQAVDEFFADKAEGLVLMPDQYGTVVVVKSRVRML